MKHPYVIIFAVGVIVFVLAWKFLMTKHVRNHDYIKVLSFYEWQSGERVRKQMEALCGYHLSPPRTYQALSRLEDEGLIERRVLEDEIEDADDPKIKHTVKISEYKLTEKAFSDKSS